MDIIEKDRRNVTDCMLELISQWLKHYEGAGDLPRTWQMVVNAVRDSGHGGLAMELAMKCGECVVSLWYSV